MRTTTITNNKEKKYFPIQTKTACRLKWSWSSLFLNTGETSSCHRASHSELTADNFFNFHNTERKLLDREKMLGGEWPGNGCEYCRDAEVAGARSDRQFQLTVPNEHPVELNSDPTLLAVDPTTVEVFFKNTCNLACIYCRATLSSRIEHEDKKFGYPLTQLADDILLDTDQYDKLIPVFWKWLDHGYKKLTNFNVLGGEPLIQDDFHKLIEYIDRNPNPNLTLHIITNLIVKKQTLIDTIHKIKQLVKKRHLKNLMISASADCWGPEQEYIRYGFECDKFQSNMEYLLDQKFLTLNLLSTVNSLSIHTMPDLAEKVKKWNNKKDVMWYTNMVLPIDQHILSPIYFDFDVYQRSLDKVLDSLQSRTNKHKETILLLEGMIDKLKKTATDNPEKRKKLMKYLMEIDLRRNLSWRKTFPWLEEIMQDVV